MEEKSGDSDNLASHIVIGVLGVIQAVVLGELVSERHLVPPTTMTFAAWEHFFQAISVLQIILLTWHEYVISLIGYKFPRAAFGLGESYLPFCLGAIEVNLAQSIGNAKAWCLWMAGFWFIGLIAYVNMYVKLAIYAPPTHYRGKYFLSIRVTNFVLTALLVVGFLYFGFELMPSMTDSSRGIFFLVINLIWLGWAVRAYLTWEDLKYGKPHRSRNRHRTVKKANQHMGEHLAEMAPRERLQAPAAGLEVVQVEQPGSENEDKEQLTGLGS